MTKPTFYITTPIYYPSDKLHIGHAYCTTIADTVARYHRAKGEDVFFLTGSDEHGLKIQRKATEMGVTPIQYVDEIIANFKLLWQRLNITNNDFIRTSEERHHKVVQSILQKIFEQSHNVLEVILAVFQKSIEMFHQTNKRFFEDIKKYPKVYEMMKNRQDSDSMKTMSFFKTGVEQGIFRSDVNFAIVNLLVREQFDVLLNTDICNEYPFIEVYESIMFTYIRGISTEKGARVLEDFIQEYRKNRIED